MRVDKRRLTTALAKHLVNPLVKAAAVSGLLGGWAILETTDHRSRRPRRTPVGNGLDRDTFWTVAEHSRQAGYARPHRGRPPSEGDRGRPMALGHRPPGCPTTLPANASGASADAERRGRPGEWRPTC